jgi:hypothetical protein
MRPNEVSEKLKLSSIAKDHVWKVEPSCATTGEGIFEGLVCFLLLFSLFYVLSTLPFLLCAQFRSKLQ